MKLTRSKITNLIFIAVIALMIIPQTRQPIQIFLNKGLAMISPSVTKEAKRDKIEDYNWQLVDMQGQSIDFNQSRNKVVLINFWATWCPPCIAEMPSLMNVMMSYRSALIFILSPMKTKMC